MRQRLEHEGNMATQTMVGVCRRGLDRSLGVCSAVRVMVCTALLYQGVEMHSCHAWKWQRSLIPSSHHCSLWWQLAHFTSLFSTLFSSIL